jgi:hypothetical protein
MSGVASISQGSFLQNNTPLTTTYHSSLGLWVNSHCIALLSPFSTLLPTGFDTIHGKYNARSCETTRALLKARQLTTTVLYYYLPQDSE